MKIKIRKQLNTLAFVFACMVGMTMPGFSSPQSAPPLRWSYSVTDLGTLPGYTGTVPYAINKYGHVAGLVCNKSHARLFIWRDNKMQDCGWPDGYSTVEVTGLNSKDEFVGLARRNTNGHEDASTAPYAFIYRNGKLHPITMPANYRCERVAALNERGQVVGSCTRDRQFYAFLFDGTTTHILFAGEAAGINDTGQIVGCAGRVVDEEGGAKGTKLVRVAGSSQTVLQNLAVYMINTSFFIDSQGTVVLLGNGLQTWTGEKRSDLPVKIHPAYLLSIPSSMNSKHHVVGYIGDDAGTSAMLIREGHLIDINTLFPASFPHHLMRANGINDNGRIVCTAEQKKLSSDPQSRASYNLRALLLTPSKSP